MSWAEVVVPNWMPISTKTWHHVMSHVALAALNPVSITVYFRFRSRLLQMHVSRQLRFRTTVEYCQQLIADMALDLRAFPGVASEVRIKSSASAPSLRARDSDTMSTGRSTPDNAGGNVKVVVRVRAFLPRGKMKERLYVIGESDLWQNHIA